MCILSWNVATSAASSIYHCDVGVCTCAATASKAIHRLETKQIVDSVMSPDPIIENHKI